MLFRQLRMLGISSIAIAAVTATSAFADVGDSTENISSETAAVSAPAKVKGQSKRQARAAARASGRVAATQAYASAPVSSSSVVAEARRYLGTNPTSRRSLWCGAFMDMVLKRTGHAGGGNLARSYAQYGTRITGPQVGALAVMTRGKNGGHVGVVSGFDANGNVTVVSGNHNNTVAESVYPRSRIIAYVMPRA